MNQETRCQALLGVRSPKRLEGKTRRAIAKARKILEGVACDWVEVDAAVSDDMDAAIASLDVVTDQGGVLDECVELLNEPWGAAWEP